MPLALVLAAQTPKYPLPPTPLLLELGGVPLEVRSARAVSDSSGARLVVEAAILPPSNRPDLEAALREGFFIPAPEGALRRTDATGTLTAYPAEASVTFVVTAPGRPPSGPARTKDLNPSLARGTIRGFSAAAGTSAIAVGLPSRREVEAALDALESREARLRREREIAALIGPRPKGALDPRVLGIVGDAYSSPEDVGIRFFGFAPSDPDGLGRAFLRGPSIYASPAPAPQRTSR